jgi:CRP/FNR family cyclic AMP-dependent transcriptional regulator
MGVDQGSGVDADLSREIAREIDGRIDRAIDRDLMVQIPIFAGLPEHALSRIFEAARVVEVAAGEEVFQEGKPARDMFIVREGEIEICKRGRNGAEFCLAVLKPGDCVGEMSLIDIQPRSATARALSAAVLYVLDHAQIARIYQTDLEVYTLLVLNIAREISRRLRCADQVLVDMGVAVQGLWVGGGPGDPEDPI